MRSLFLLSVPAALLTGCDVGTYPQLWESTDAAVALGEAEAFVARTDDGLGVLLLSNDGDGGAFTLALLQGEAAQTVTGTWVQGSGEMEMQADYRWDKEDESHLSRLKVKGPSGSSVTDVRIASYASDERGMWVDDLLWLELDHVLGAIDPTTEQGAHDVMSLYALTLELGQNRVLGFGGAGMMQYLDNPTDFTGLVGGTQTVSIHDIRNPENIFAYEGFEELPGLQLDGERHTRTDASATSGHLFGTVDFLWDLDDEEGTVLEGSVYYGSEDGSEGVQLVDSNPGAGAYVLTLDGVDWTIPFDEFGYENLYGLLEDLSAD